MAPSTIKQRVFAFGSNVKNDGSVQQFMISGSFAVASTLIEIRSFPHVTQAYVGSMHFVQEVHFRVKNIQIFEENENVILLMRDEANFYLKGMSI